MKCAVVKDLIPLYIDDCCSKESAELVKEHLENCIECREIYENMKDTSDITPVVSTPKKLSKINDWKASILQSVLLFISFAIITVGVAMEAKTPSGLLNGFWALKLVIPATGFLFSLTNWFFVRLYKSRKVFSNACLLATLSLTICAYIWSCCHYELNFIQLLQNMSMTDFLEALYSIVLFYAPGICLTAVLCALSKILSNVYAKMLGKE